jgi:hypothetical protein
MAYQYELLSDKPYHLQLSPEEQKETLVAYRALLARWEFHTATFASWADRKEMEALRSVIALLEPLHP